METITDAQIVNSSKQRTASYGRSKPNSDLKEGIS